MKIGDKTPVMLAGQQVAEATIVEIEDNRATLIVPATRVVMAVRTSLEPEVAEPQEPTGNSHVLLGDEREAPGAAAPVGENDNSSTPESPVTREVETSAAPQVVPTLPTGEPAPVVEAEPAQEAAEGVSDAPANSDPAPEPTNSTEA